MSLTEQIRRAYDLSGEAWNDGPALVYRAFAQPVLDRVGKVDGARVLDVGTGSGVLADELVRRGADVVGVDLSFGMLRRHAGVRPPGLVADVRALPLRSRSADLVTASFVLNHLEVPADGVREIVRVLRPGGRLLATTFEGEAPHPAKAVLEEVAERHGFVPPTWYASVKTGLMPLLSTGERFAEAARAGGMRHVRVDEVEVPLALSPSHLVAWRLGMAHTAPFVEGLAADEREALVAEAERAVAEISEPVMMAVLVLEGTA